MPREGSTWKRIQRQRPIRPSLPMPMPIQEPNQLVLLPGRIMAPRTLLPLAVRRTWTLVKLRLISMEFEGTRPSIPARRSLQPLGYTGRSLLPQVLLHTREGCMVMRRVARPTAMEWKASRPMEVPTILVVVSAQAALRLGLTSVCTALRAMLPPRIGQDGSKVMS